LSKKFTGFPSNREKEFLNHYNTIETLIKDKDIKYIQFIGKELMTPEEIENVFSARRNKLNNDNFIKRQQDLSRYKTEVHDSCSVDRHSPYFMEPTFNHNLNDKFFKTRHYYKIFLKMLTKVVVRNRAEKRLDSLNSMFRDNRIKNPIDFAKVMQKDWHDYFTKDAVSEETNIKLKFIPFTEVYRSHLYQSNEININSLKQEIPHETNINLEEFKSYDILERNDIEAMGYKGK
jgi:hypothetical protein